MQVGLIGLGNFGSAIGHLIASNGHGVLGWEYDEKVVAEVNAAHVNTRFLPGIALHSGLVATSDLEGVFRRCEVVFVALPSVFIRPTLGPVRDAVDEAMLLVNMAKGIDRETGRTAFQTVADLFPRNRKVVLSGPSVANEFVRKMPTTVVVAGAHRGDLLTVAHLLDTDAFRTRFSDDVVGVELGGGLKNIYAIGLGLFDGKSVTSINFRAVYLTIALEEIARFGVCMGAQVETFLYLSGIGDLLATSLSAHSHNRHLGESLARGASLAEVEEEMGVLPEGYNTLDVVLYLAEKMHVSLPLAKGLWDVIHGRYEAEAFIAAFIKDFVE